AVLAALAGRAHRRQSKETTMFSKLLAVNRKGPIRRDQLKGSHLLLALSLALCVAPRATAQHQAAGTVSAWGYNYYGQLGNGSATTSPPYGILTPVQVVGPGGAGSLTGVTALAAGPGDTIALKSDGTVWAWGWNLYGQLGDG